MPCFKAYFPRPTRFFVEAYRNDQVLYSQVKIPITNFYNSEYSKLSFVCQFASPYAKLPKMAKYKPLILVILDGFGISTEKAGNPVAEAKTPTFDELERFFPFTTLQASGVAVGLPWGEAGNSEVGHLTMGSGRVIYHHLPRIINAIKDGSFFKNEALLGAVAHVRNHNSRLHIAGLISSGSVHSYIDHLWALAEFTKQENLAPVYLHIFTDGRDAPPSEGAEFLKKLEDSFHNEAPHIKYASVIGRSYAMDREEHWERIQTCYELLTQGKGEQIRSVPDYLKQAYTRGESDESIESAFVLRQENGRNARIQENDALIFLNFREDSMREITHAFTDETFTYFPRKKIENLFVVTMTEYQKGLSSHPAFPALDIQWPLARVLGEAGLRHLHIAETEKYAHVTYFFNGGREEPFPGEKRILIPSTPTLHPDENPEMRVPAIADAIVENMDESDVIIANFANADIVGHSGNFAAAVKAVEALDTSLEKLLNTVLNTEGVMLITGDHGNIELKRNVHTGEKLTEHSLNPVPFFIVGNKFRRSVPLADDKIQKAKAEINGILTDIAPTILELLKLKKPSEMTGNSLLSILS